MDRLIVEEERQATSAESDPPSAAVGRKAADSEADVGEDLIDDGDEFRELPRRLTDLLRLTGPPVAALFADFDFGEEAPPLPEGSPAGACAAAFLMAWRLALRLVAGSGRSGGADLRPKYSEFLRREGLLGELMPVLFHLLPAAAATAEAECSSTDLPGFASSVYLNLLRHLPALVSALKTSFHYKRCSFYGTSVACFQVRQWWGNAEKRVSDHVEKYTVSFVAPALWAEEADEINRSNLGFDNMTVRDGERGKKGSCICM